MSSDASRSSFAFAQNDSFSKFLMFICHQSKNTKHKLSKNVFLLNLDMLTGNGVITACSIVGSRIDYCNGLLFGASGKAFNRLQRVQNNLARAVFDIGIRKLHDSGRRSLDLLRELHWLPVQARVKYKVALLCFKCYKLEVPTYLSSLLKQYRSTRSLRLSFLDILSVPRSKTKTASRRFSIAAPNVWNSLLATIRAASSVGSFRSQLKTHLYHLSFD